MVIKTILDKYNKVFKKTDMDKSENTIYSKKIEKLLYLDKKSKFSQVHNNYDLSNIEESAKDKVDNFEYLVEDIYNILYQPSPKKADISKISDDSLRFNKKIVDEFLESSQAQTLRSITKGKSFESLQACSTVVSDIYSNLDVYLKSIYGDVSEQIIKQYNEKIQNRIEKLQSKIKDYNTTTSDYKKENLEKEIQSLDNQIESMKSIVNSLCEKIETTSISNSQKISDRLNNSIEKALEEAELNSLLSETFGLDISDNTKSITENHNILENLKNNYKIINIAKMMGRLKYSLKAKAKSDYADGRGIVMGLEYGNDLSRILPEELALLGHEKTKKIFFRKYVNRELLLYKEKERKPKNKGDLLILADESGSMESGNIPAYSYSKGITLTLANILCRQKRNLIYLPFDSSIGEEFLINYKTKNPDLINKLATNLLGGGTNFDLILNHTINKYLNNPNYNKMDILFITDGHSNVNTETLKTFNALRKNKKINCISLLLDAENVSTNDSVIKQFSDKILKFSELGIENASKEIGSFLI